MSTNNELTQLVEKYLNGEMEGDELFQFENRLNTDTDFLEYVMSLEELTRSIRLYGNRNHLKDRLNKIHSTISFPLKISTVKIDLAREVSMWKKHYKIILVAASVALISVISTLSIVNQWYLGKKQNVKYTELRREIDNLKRKQFAMIKDIKTDASANYKPVKYSGSGFVISSEGYIVTSYHVIKEATSIVIQNEKNTYKAVSVFNDKGHDLAILKIVDDQFTSFSPIPYIFKPNDALLGENVYTLGFPREDIVYGEGSVSSKSGYEGDTASYQVSIPVNPGNSGSPLFDEKGYLIGMISGKEAELDAAAFAVKSNYLLNILDSLPENGQYKQLVLSKKNLLGGITRTQQIRKLEEFIFNIKVYN